MTHRTILAAGFLWLLILLPTGASAQLKTPVKYIKGILQSTASNDPVDGGRIYVYQGSIAEPVTNSRINPGNGEFKVLLDPSTDYRFEVIAPSFYRTTINFRTPPEIDYEEIDTTFRIPPIPIGQSLYSGRLFEPGSADLRADAGLSSVIATLKRQPNVAVTIGIVPEVTAAAPAPVKKAPKKPAKRKKGSPPPPPVDTVAVVPAINLNDLAQSRQNAVKAYFKAQGISVTRLSWELKPGVVIPRTGGSLQPNVTIRISSIEPLDEDD